MTAYLQKYGHELCQKGLQIIPIRQGTKKPNFAGWQNTKADLAQVDAWLASGHADSGIGLLTDRFPTIDIDIPGVHNAGMVDRVIKICEEELDCGAEYIKIGQPPKASIICRASVSFGKKLKTAVYRDPLGDAKGVAVEILGSGQQTVLLNTHPDTGKPYEWTRKCVADPDFSVDKLPLLTREVATRILERVESEVLCDFIPNRIEPANLPSGQTPEFFPLSPPCDFSMEQIRADLDVLDPDIPYDDWKTVGMGLHHQFGGDEEGFDLFDEWSSEGAEYEPDGPNSPRAKWKSFGIQSGSRPVTMATVRMMANEVRREKTKASRQGFNFIPFTEMLNRDVKPDWLIKGFLDKGSLSLIFGESGSHKSFLALGMGLSIATGKNWQWYETGEPTPVFYIAGEGFAGISKRLKAWKIHNLPEGDYGDIPFYTSNMAAEFLNEDSAKAVTSAINELSNEHGAPGLVILDTLARNFGPGDENSTADMSAFISAIDRHLKEPLRCSVLIVHHSGLSDKNRARGNYALKAALDNEFMVEMNGADRILTNTKSKDYEPPPSLVFTPKIIDLSTVDFDSEESEVITSCVLELTMEREHTAVNRKLPKAQQLTLDALRKTAQQYEILYSENDSIPVPGDLWRDAAIEAGISEGKPDSQKTAFKRAKEALVKSGLVKDWDGLYLLA
jgi:hypothetical protein